MGLNIIFKLSSNFAPFIPLHFKPSFHPLAVAIWENATDKGFSLLISFWTELELPQSKFICRSYDRSTKHCHKLLGNNYLCAPLLPTLHFPLLTLDSFSIAYSTRQESIYEVDRIAEGDEVHEKWRGFAPLRTSVTVRASQNVFGTRVILII